MGREILNLEPGALWKHFYNLTQIPRLSKKEGRVRDFVVAFGRNLGLETVVDGVGNVVIRKPASEGMGNRKGVVLQAHLDMVPQKNSGTAHDFDSDPIDARIDRGWVRASGTTLGADNGIGVAAAMAVLESDDLCHGMVEALFTVDEEAGMGGAFGLKPGLLKGEVLMNLDSEDEGELYIGCAGGLNANMTHAHGIEAVPEGSEAFRISVTGLKGGHSGLDIDLGRGNSNKILNRFLWTADRRLGLRVASIDGGSLRNAIPRESFAVVTVHASGRAAFLEAFDAFAATVRKELAAVEPDLRIAAESTALPVSVMEPVSQRRILDALYACPNGVIRMSPAMPGLVETSINLAVVQSEEGRVSVQCLLRSSVDSAMDDLACMVQSVFELAGGDVVFDGRYPGWKPDPSSPLLEALVDVYNGRFGRFPEVKAIHAGLECGLIGSVYPELDMISFGPTIRYPHSPDEKVDIDSVGRFWNFLVESLKAVPEK